MTSRNTTINRPVIVAHRGASGLYPENTILALRAAHQDGVEMLEIDVRLTSDCEVVVIHDKSVERTTNGKGKVSALSASEIKALDAGSKFTTNHGQTFPFAGAGLKIPLLTEVLKELPTARIQIELKDNNKKLAAKVIEIIRQNNAFERTQIATAHSRLSYMTSEAEPKINLTHSAVDAIFFVLCSIFDHAYRPNFHTGFIDLPVCFFRYRPIMRRATAIAKKHRLRIRVYTVNDLDQMKELVSLGVEGFFTDYPTEAKGLVDALIERQD
ncbi:MAG: hypothetical protein C0508_10990 [Cyanobacteria bacterium PR.023]|nr:hypothetical protein [Cyanobacteria bacterium PR.023]